MAAIESCGLSFGITRVRDREWVFYQVTFAWRGNPIINEKIFKDESEAPCSFLWLEDDVGDPVGFFKTALDANQETVLQPSEPDIRLR